MFYHLRNLYKRPWAGGGEALGIFQKSAFTASGVAEPGEEHKLTMFCPELFRGADNFTSATSYKENVSWRSEMGDLFQWMLTYRDDNTIVAVTDARSPTMRFQLQIIAVGTQRGELKHLENHSMHVGNTK